MSGQADRSRSAARVRRLATAAALAGGLALALQPFPVAQAQEAAPSVRCSLTDARLSELSGLVAVGDQMLALTDGGSQVTVFGLDASCAVVDVQTAPVDPYDPEDLAVGPGGTVWVADVGDNGSDRATVALHVLRPGGAAMLHRLTYPDGPHDAEALLVAPDGTPYVVTKEVLGSSGVYRPAGELVDGGTVAMERVGTVNVSLTGTPGGPVGRAGQLMITGGAVALDGTALALRTYTDAYVWPLTGSDVPGALTGTPARVALPESPQGEAISFTADSRSLLVAGEGVPGDIAVVPRPTGAAPPTTTAPPSGDPLPTLADLAQPERSPLPAAVVAAALAALVVWLGGRLRRRP